MPLWQILANSHSIHSPQFAPFVKQMKKLIKAEERPKEVAKKARRKKDPTQREAISGDYAPFDQAMCSTYLLVDGYNVIK